jgi:hypothetical protein
VLLQHRLQITQTAQVIAKLGLADLHDQRGRVERFVAEGFERGAATRRLQLPGVIARSGDRRLAPLRRSFAFDLGLGLGLGLGRRSFGFGRRSFAFAPFVLFAGRDFAVLAFAFFAAIDAPSLGSESLPQLLAA